MFLFLFLTKPKVSPELHVGFFSLDFRDQNWISWLPLAAEQTGDRGKALSDCFR